MKNRGSIEHNTTCFSKYAPKIADSHTRVQSQAGLFPPCMSYYTRLHFLELFLQKPRDPLENQPQLSANYKWVTLKNMFIGSCAAQMLFFETT